MSVDYRRHPALLLILALVLSVPGCRFAVGMLRAIGGDPMVPSEFKTRLGVDLAKSEKRLLVICTAGHSASVDQASLPIDIVTGVARKLNTHGIDVVDPDDVSNWFDENGDWGDLAGLAESFDADYVAVVHVSGLTYKEPKSTNLLRGRANGSIVLHEIQRDNDRPRAVERYRSTINETYPAYPVSTNQFSEAMFRDKTLDHLTKAIARRFHEYHQRDTVL